MTLPECATYADVERLDGKQAAVVGVYEQVDVRAWSNLLNRDIGTRDEQAFAGVGR